MRLPPARRSRALPVLALLLLAGCGAPPSTAPAAPVTAPTSTPAPLALPSSAPTTPAPTVTTAPAVTRDDDPVVAPPADRAPARDDDTPAPRSRDVPAPRGGGGADVGEPRLYAITCDQTEAQVAASGAPRVRRGDATIYIGGQQVGGDDQAPRVVRFDDGERTWCRDDLERSGDDGRGYGLLWSGEVLLGVFSAVGNQGEPSRDLRRFTGSGWLRSYADGSPRGGGGAKVAVVVGLDPGTGAGIPGRGTWITADNDRKVNSATVTGLALDGDGVRVTVESAFTPRQADRSGAECDGSSPFTAEYVFDRSLGDVEAVTLDDRCS